MSGIEDPRDTPPEVEECVDCGEPCSVLLERCVTCQREADDLEVELLEESYRRIRARR